MPALRIGASAPRSPRGGCRRRTSHGLRAQGVREDPQGVPGQFQPASGGVSAAPWRLPRQVEDIVTAESGASFEELAERTGASYAEVRAAAGALYGMRRADF